MHPVIDQKTTQQGRKVHSGAPTALLASAIPNRPPESAARTISNWRTILTRPTSTEAQEARATIGSQLEVLRTLAGEDGHEVAGEFLDDGYSGARLDRPGLDALRDGAQAGLFEAVLCLTPDRLARAYAYQFLVLEELARHGVKVLFSDAPPLDDDPQARLLVQMQGVIAEYERGTGSLGAVHSSTEHPVMRAGAGGQVSVRSTTRGKLAVTADRFTAGLDHVWAMANARQDLLCPQGRGIPA